VALPASASSSIPKKAFVGLYIAHNFCILSQAKLVWYPAYSAHNNVMTRAGNPG